MEAYLIMNATYLPAERGAAAISGKLRKLRRQRGLALPVMLIMLVVMLIGGVYMMKASTNSTLATASLAYDSSLSRAADLGLMRGSAWLATTAAGAGRSALDAHQSAAGYRATYDPAQAVTSTGFWDGSVTVTDTTPEQNRIQYVIHRMCASVGRFDAAGPPANTCVQTTPNLSLAVGGVKPGESLASDAIELPGAPQIHYVITSRIFGARGTNVVNQSVVMIGA